MRLILPSLCAATCAIALAGCVESFPEFHASAGDLRTGLTVGAAGSPRAATVAITSLNGAPDDIAARFSQAFQKDASAREITTTDVSKAHYLVRGYLSATPGDTGTDVTYLYDIFDANDQQRVDRVSDTISVPSSGDEPWAQANDAVIASLAGRSADALASMLADTPVAKAALNPTMASVR